VCVLFAIVKRKSPPGTKNHLHVFEYSVTGPSYDVNLISSDHRYSNYDTGKYLRSVCGRFKSCIELDRMFIYFIQSIITRAFPEWSAVIKR